MTKREQYCGREQSRVKHFILRHYLERFAHIIGSTWTTITYVDCFSGPWQSSADDLSDTSFAIALAELRKARNTLAERNKLLSIRCLFLEENPTAHSRLREYAQNQTDATIITRNATLLDSIPDIVNFIQEGGRCSFRSSSSTRLGGVGSSLKRFNHFFNNLPGKYLSTS